MRPPRLLPVLAAGALVLAACGDDDTSSTADSVAVQADPPADAAPADDSAADTAAPEAEPENDAGTGDTESGVDASDDLDAGSADSAGEPAADEPAADDAAAPGLRSTRLDDGRIDLIGPDVDAAADVESNLLPSVVVDDLQTGAKVNFRNVAPQNLPILLWMYAPH
ncbi:MAG: hypothetical protein AAGD33_05350 [Actinomycetota bacterium]